MSTRQQANAAKERLWRRTLKNWRRSGLTVRAFCRLHDVAEPSFYFWRRELDHRDRQPPAFVPVEVVPDHGAANSSRPAGLELLLADGRVLRIGPAFDAPTLRRLLALLEERRP